MNTNFKDQNKCKWHNFGCYNCFVYWPTRCYLDLGKCDKCKKYEEKDDTCN